MSGNSSVNEENSQALRIVMAYPFALITVSILVNVFAFGIDPFEITLPTIESIRALSFAAVLLLVNHTWIMNSTELTRVRYRLYSNPAEWAASDRDPARASAEGLDEVETHHNAHRNTTENTIYFALLSSVFIIVSPPVWAAMVWTVAYAVARLGYTYSYLVHKIELRGIFMSISLLALYGMGTYLVGGAILAW